MARPTHVVRLKQSPKAEIAKVDARIAELGRRFGDITAEIEALPLEKVFTDEHRLVDIQKRISEEIEALTDRRDALTLQDMGLEPTKAAEEQKAPVSTAHPPLPYDPIWPVSADATDEERKAAELMNSFMGDIRADAGKALDGKITVVSYTQQRHLSIEMALGLLRLWARAERERGDALEARLEAVEAHTEDLRARGLFYSGVHQRALGYERGSMTTHRGSAWIALVDIEPGEIPGECPKWGLAVKKGRDGKDHPSWRDGAPTRAALRAEQDTDAEGED